MQEFSKQTQKMDMGAEMMDDAIDGMFDGEEGEADELVDQVGTRTDAFSRRMCASAMQSLTDMHSCCKLLRANHMHGPAWLNRLRFRLHALHVRR